MKQSLVSVLSIFILGIFSFNFLSASEIHVQGRSYTISCSYYNKTTGDFVVQYQNNSLPWGTKVFLTYGADGYTIQYGPNPAREIKLTWQNKTEIEIFAYSEFTWGADLSMTIHERTTPDVFNGIDFVFRIVLPDGTEFYDNGGASNYGYYVANLTSQIGQCSSSERALPRFDQLEVQVRP